MRVFIGMETSGVTRRFFESRGHEVISCDLLPADDGAQNHIVGDVFQVLENLRALGWKPDLGIFHPTCTHLTISAAWAFKDPDFVKYPGVGYHQKVKPGTLTGKARRDARDQAVKDVIRIWKLDIPAIVIENPIGYLSTMWQPPTQVIQPYQFGEDASKATCLWIRGKLPLIIDPKKYFYPRMVCSSCDQSNHYHSAFGYGCNHCGAEAGKLKPRWGNQTNGGQNKHGPKDDRWKDRSETFSGIGEAFALNWG